MSSFYGAISALTADLAKQWEKIYLVGSIYISANSTSPAELFGGTWEQIKDRFLLAAGDTYAAGSTGGEAQHTLTVKEMPSHTHAWKGKNTGAFSDTGATYRFPIEGNDQWDPPMVPTGGSQPHNNMPPYITAYCWHRVA